MMKKRFLMLTMVLLGLFAGARSAFGQGDMFSGVDPTDPTKWFYVQLTAGISNPGCGTTTPGQVWMVSTTCEQTDWINPETGETEYLLDENGQKIHKLKDDGSWDYELNGSTGETIYIYLKVQDRLPYNPWITGPKPTNPFDPETESTSSDQWKEGYDKAINDFTYGYPRAYDDMRWNGDDWATARAAYDYMWDNWYLLGHSMNATNPVEYASSVSLKGTAVAYAPGFDDIAFGGNWFSSYAYFYGKVQENPGWYFTGWSYTEGESDLGGVIAGSARNDSTMFRVLPSATPGEANCRMTNVYATFQPIRVSNYKVNSLINTSVSNSTTVTFEAVGERVSDADFNVSVEETNFSASIISCVDNKVTVTVTYNGEEAGEFQGNVTLASKSGCSQLTAPVYARVGADASNEATLYDGKTPTSTSGTLLAMIAAANNTDKIVVLNKNYEDDLTVNAKVTINFNGYTIQDLTVESGEVTIAYSKYGSNGEAVSVTGGKLILNGGEFASLTVGTSGIVEQNGATITGASTNNGILLTSEGRFESGLTSNGTLTIDGGAFEGATAITIAGGTANINKATVNGTTYGIQATGGITNVTSKLVSVNGGTNAIYGNGGTVNLNNGKFVGETAPLAGTINLQAGYFKVDGANIGISVPSGKKVLNVLAGAEFAEGYRYFVGDDASSVGVCRIGTTSYATLEEALAYANNTGETVTIIMTNDYTLPAGYYTLPANATLIVPMNNEQETGYSIVNRVSNNSASAIAYVQPTEFRRLTFAKGVNMDVHGLIELTGTQRASDDAYATLPHGPYGHLVMEEGSHMTLQNGSELRAWGYMTGAGETDARRGSTVREQFQMGDWKGGSISFAMLAAENTRVFPVTQYYIQNIESPVKYHPGAALSTTTSVSANFGGAGMTAMANDIIVVGVTGAHTGMFLMDQEADAENTWVRKRYDAEHDTQVYDVNSGAHLGSIVLDLGKLGVYDLVMNSGYFVLPITNNMKIHLLSGMMDFTQTTSLLPGAEVEVDKESVIKIVRNSNPDVYSGALYIYDADDWSYAGGKGDAKNTFYRKVVPYSASLDRKPTVHTETAKPADAKINIHGTFDTGQGAVYTTPGGANIFSTNEDAGTFIVSLTAPTATSDVYQYVMSSKSSGGYTSVAATSAKLKNGDGTYKETAGSEGWHAHIYMDNEWKGDELTFYFDCFTAQIDMDIYLQEAIKRAVIGAPHMAEYLLYSASNPDPLWGPQEFETYKESFGDAINTIRTTIEYFNTTGYNLGNSVQSIYIKPQEWVEITGTAEITFPWNQTTINEWDADYAEGDYTAFAAYWNYLMEEAYHPSLVGVTGNSDHTFSDAAGAGRLFILMNKGCQWWEVEKKDNLYHCIHPENDTYYYWGQDPSDLKNKWLEKKFTISWQNWDGTPIETNNGDAEGYEVTYGTMAEFLGTNPTREKTIDYTYDFAGWSPALGPVTSDVTYTATYTQKDRMYTVIFQNEGGVEIERQFLKHNDIPVCENVPTKVGHTLEWSPAIAAVTGDATYTATWLEEPPTEYEVTFFDYNGTTELQKGNVAVGTVPTPPADPTGKPATSEYTYVFDRWSPALEVVSATSIKSYTAVYREVEQTYTVRFYQEDGTTQIGDAQSLTYGAMPEAPQATKQDPQTGYTYAYVWQNKADASKALETVKADADYKAVFTSTLNKYTVTVKSNPSGACSSTGAGLYDYNTSATITLTVNDGYTFTGWSDGQEETNTTRTITVTEDKELVANFEVADPDYTITWNNEDGSLIYSQGQKANTATVFTGAIPTKSATADKTFTFYGWTTEQGGTDSIKNGLTPKATANATYYAFFTKEPRKYTITWANEAGTANIEVDYNQPYGAAIAYNSATPTKAATAEYTYTFDGWSTTVGEAAVSVPATVSGDAIFYAHFKETARTLEVGVGETEDFTLSTQLSNLTLTSNGDASGQITGANYLNITGNADFVLQQSMSSGKWYSIAVPWRVEANGGIYLGNSTTPASLGPDFEICYYDGAVRAAQGTVDACWVYMKKLNASQKVLEPGKAYMIYLKRGSVDKITFRKKAQAPLLTTGTSVNQYDSSTGDDKDGGWNGIANPALYYAYVNAGADDEMYGENMGQVYDAENVAYVEFDMEDKRLVVGQPIYVQVPAAKTIVANNSSYGAAPVRRAGAQVRPTSFAVTLNANGTAFTDKLTIRLNENKDENKYIIGQDLVKFGVSNKVAQMWINRYDSKLCINTVAPEGDATNFPMSIFAPKDGAYTIAIEHESNADEYTLYLTLNGEAVWNLSDGAYVANLQKGTNNNYGLRISARAPHVVTGCDEAIVNAQGETRKVLINNKVFIIRGNNVYSIDGQLVK